MNTINLDGTEIPIVSLQSKKIPFAIGDKFNFVYACDIHMGCNGFSRTFFDETFGQALESKNTYIGIGGDLFDAITAKDAKRFRPDIVDSEHGRRSDILNAQLEMATKLLTPYKSIIAFISMGNHEESMLHWSSFNLISSMCSILEVPYGDVAGFYGLRFANKCCNGRDRAVTIFYHHGSGHDSPVSRNSIAFNRLLTQVEGVDAIVLGHKHYLDAYKVIRRYMNKKGCLSYKPIVCLSTGSFVAPDTNRWALSRMMSPKPMGVATLTIQLTHSRHPLNLTGVI